jgi:predicted phosphoribosyltransferase
MAFVDRQDAGQRLAKAVAALGLDWSDGGLVLGAARGGVLVAAPVASSLGARLDVAVVRKIGAPHQPELAIGAVAENGSPLLNHDLIRRLRLGAPEVAVATEGARRELTRRAAAYREGRAVPHLRGETVALVDDGVATGATIVALARWARSESPATLVIAVPVGVPETLRMLADEADHVVALERPRELRAVGEWYTDFHQVSDEEMMRVLRDGTAIS